MYDANECSEEPLVQCGVCLEEIPLSEVQNPETTDYVIHFCGLDCYEVWRKQSEQSNDE